MTRQTRDEPPPDISAEARKLVGLYLESRLADLARLDAALAAGDFETIRAVGHIFRGSSDNFGFPEAGRLGALIEEAAGRADREAVVALAPLLRASIANRGAGNT